MAVAATEAQCPSHRMCFALLKTFLKDIIEEESLLKNSSLKNSLLKKKPWCLLKNIIEQEDERQYRSKERQS
jgi:hypothetical protein